MGPAGSPMQPLSPVDPLALESAQGSIQMGTDGGFVAPQYTPTDIGEVGRPAGSPALPFIAGAVVMAGLVFGALAWMTAPGPSEAAVAAVEAPATPPVATPALDDGLRALAQVNVRDPGRALPFARRHALLGQLEGGPDAERIDRTLNWALDLVQAGDSEMPCETFAQALDALEATPEPEYSSLLNSARAPDPSCAALDDQRTALLARLTSPEPVTEVETPAPESGRTRGRGRSRGKGRTKGKTKDSSSKSSTTSKQDKEPTSASTNVGGKLDDGLRPFGK